MWNFRELVAWREARTVIVDVYRITSEFPDTERFGLTSQLRRATNSIGANIAEACGRPTDRDRAQFLGYAISSAEETEHHLIIARDVGIVPASVSDELICRVDQIRRMTKALRRRCL